MIDMILGIRGLNKPWLMVLMCASYYIPLAYTLTLPGGGHSFIFHKGVYVGSTEKLQRTKTSGSINLR